MIYTVVITYHISRAVKLYMGELVTIWTRFEKFVLLAILVTVHIKTCILVDKLSEDNCDYVEKIMQLYRLKYNNVILF